MIIEALYPEICCLYGDMANIRYLSQCLPDAEIKMTPFTETPYFADNDVDMLYLGSMSELTVSKVLQKLMPLKNRLAEIIKSGTVVLFTGNAMSILGEKIICDDGEIPALGLYPHYTKRFMNDRHNSMFYGTYNGYETVGCKSQFDFYYNVKGLPFMKVGGGVGNNPDDEFEGFKDNHLFATSLLGPLLILNPRFTRELLALLGTDAAPAFEKEATEAFEFRLKELKTEGAQLIMHC